jgi:hypothetical protein
MPTAPRTTQGHDERRVRTLYDHNRSVERRAPESPDPLAATRAAFRDKHATLMARHRRERSTLENDINKKIARDQYKGDPGKADLKRRADMERRHAAERDDLDRRRKAALDAASRSSKALG